MVVVIRRYHLFAFVPQWNTAASLVEAAIAAAVMYLWLPYIRHAFPDIKCQIHTADVRVEV